MQRKEEEWRRKRIMEVRKEEEEEQKEKAEGEEEERRRKGMLEFQCDESLTFKYCFTFYFLFCSSAYNHIVSL